MRPAHLEFFDFVFGEQGPPWDECFGNTMVDVDFMPVGFAIVWFRHNGTVTVHAYFGEYLKTYPKDILRGMQPTMQRLREIGVTDLYAVAHESVPGSDTLIKWFKGVPTDQSVEGQGRYYRMNLLESPI